MDDEIPLTDEELAIVEEIRNDKKRPNLSQKKLRPDELDRLFVSD